jgi:hypothetical protein
VDEFDCWDCGVGVFCHFLLELFDVGDCGDVDVELEGLLLGGGFEYESYHLKKISNHFVSTLKNALEFTGAHPRTSTSANEGLQGSSLSEVICSLDHSRLF